MRSLMVRLRKTVYAVARGMIQYPLDGQRTKDCLRGPDGKGWLVISLEQATHMCFALCLSHILPPPDQLSNSLFLLYHNSAGRYVD